MTDVAINSGTTIGVSASLPATYDGAGYGALTFTSVGEVVDVGEIAKAFNMVSHQGLSRRYPQKLKDTYDIADLSLTIGRVFADAGQVILQAARDSDNSYAFEITLPNGDVFNFTAKVTKLGVGAIATGGISTTVATLAVDPESLYEV